MKTSMPLCHCNCYPLSQPRDICPRESGGSWADMKTSMEFSCPLPREKWLQQVIPLFRLVTQRSDILALGCRKACKIKNPVSDALQMALAAWHEWMSGFPWETKCVCTVHLLSIIPKYSWGKREDFGLSQRMGLEPITLTGWGSLDGHQVCWQWSSMASTCPWTHLQQGSPQSPQSAQPELEGDILPSAGSPSISAHFVTPMGVPMMPYYC